MKRRPFLIGAGLAAAALGAGLALRTGKPLSPEAQKFWAAKFQHLDGSELAVAPLRGKPLLLNFWASWCTPCVKELPDIERFAQEMPSWQVLALALDQVENVQAFLARLPLKLPLGLAGLTGFEMARMLGNAQGGLPFSVAFDAHGEIFWHKLGPTDLAELRQISQR
jgi:thiol-disulfide isomerase/thioredoxin